MFEPLQTLLKYKCPTFSTFENKYLYKRNNIYYFSKRIKSKPFKISLHSNNLKHCKILRDKILKKMEDYNMFKIEKNGIKLEFEYDTEGELLKYIEAIKPLMGKVKDENTSYYPDFFEQ